MAREIDRGMRGAAGERERLDVLPVPPHTMTT
jgi:hypothetical protein